MSSAIKPPGAPGSPAAPDVGGAKGATGSPEAFREELAKTGAADAPGEARPAAGASRAEMLRALADDVRAGRLEPAQAIDRLVERALSTGPAASLPPARRAELEATLRAALEDDPTLASMQKDLARGR